MNTFKRAREISIRDSDLVQRPPNISTAECCRHETDFFAVQDGVRLQFRSDLEAIGSPGIFQKHEPFQFHVVHGISLGRSTSQGATVGRRLSNEVPCGVQRILSPRSCDRHIRGHVKGWACDLTENINAHKYE